MMSWEVWTALLVVLISLGLLYIFYPAIVLQGGDAVGVTVKVLSNEPTNEEANDILFSIIIPAYNEEARLAVMLDATIEFLKHHRATVITKCQQRMKEGTTTTAIEWIIVNDGSTDNTVQAVQNYYNSHISQNKDSSNKDSSNTTPDIWKLISLSTNSGKGFAVQQGMIHASGAMRLMVDADGATDMNGLLTLLDHDNEIIFGSRAHLQTAQRSFVRTLLMHAFHFFVSILCCSDVQDTQCGFKLFTASAADQLFPTLHLRKWAFDIELVICAQRLGLWIQEVHVPWKEVDGSKLDTSKLQLALVSVGMLRDMICVRLCYELGIWKINRTQ